jgi:hypothetical protein
MHPACVNHSGLSYIYLNTQDSLAKLMANEPNADYTSLSKFDGETMIVARNDMAIFNAFASCPQLAEVIFPNTLL